MGSFWHPFATMGAVEGNELVIDRGEGVYVFDTSGKRYLDGTASLWYCNVGYGRTEIGEAVADQMRRLHTFHTFGDYSNPPAIQLADRISAVAPVAASKVFFTSGGSDSVDSAAKLARRYFAETGQPDRRVLITRSWAYHGMHGWGTSLAGIGANLEHSGRTVSDVVEVEWDSIDSLRAAIDEIGAERVAGLFAEPVIGAGGVRFPGEAYLKEANRLVREAGGLFIADEVVTAFGRIGAWFASERYSLEPDIITFAKGVTSGYLPLGGLIVAPRVAEPFWSGQTMWRHGYTYSGHASACVAALANLDIIENEDLIGRALVLESDLTEALAPLASHELVSEVRSGAGVLAAVQLDPDLVSADPGAPARAAAGARAAGVITRVVAGGGLQASPPLTINAEELGELAAGLRAGLDAAR
jgi:adenosylmethionine-8-amino-7-oxononanoate aminotransferase